MLTFDDYLNPLLEAGIEQLHGELPQLIEIGETPLYWLRVNRTSKQIELVSKQVPNLVLKCDIEQAESYGLSARMIKSAQAALTL